MDDFIGCRNLIPPEKLRELTRRSDSKGAIQALSHFGAIAVTGTGLWLTWGSWWAAPWFVVHGMLVNFLFAAQHECNHYTAFKTRWVNDLVKDYDAVMSSVEHLRTTFSRESGGSWPGGSPSRTTSSISAGISASSRVAPPSPTP